MARILAELALFLVPFLAFALYLRFGRRVDSVFAAWSFRALLGCAVAALLLVGLSLVIFEAASRGPTTGRYVPPTWEDGILVPGHVE